MGLCTQDGHQRQTCHSYLPVLMPNYNAVTFNCKSLREYSLPKTKCVAEVIFNT